MRAWLGLGLLLGCSPGVARSDHGLTDATDDSGHPSVGRYVFSTDGSTQNGGCTATVIGAHTLLTAGHCAGYTLTEVELGDPPQRYAVDRDLAHPEWTSSRAWERDVALIFTVDALPQPAVPIERRLAMVGEPVVLVGFGETSYGARDNGTKRRATNDVEALEDQYFIVQGTGAGEGNGCRGDSGGPALVEADGLATVLGVMSYVPGLGSGSGCGDATWITRLDLYLAWIATESGGDAVFVDSIGPQVQILAPLNGATVGRSAPVQVAATDDHAVTEVVVAVDGVPYASVPGASFAETIELGIGRRRISVRAKDATGNEGTAAIDVEVVDPEVPDPVEPESGCSAVAHPGLEALLLVFGLAAQRRMRTRR